MDQTIIFSNPTQILHTELLQNSQILLTTPTQLILFSLSTAKVIKQYTIAQQIMPIQTWVIQQWQAQLTNQQNKIALGVKNKEKEKDKDKDFTIVIQGKMGFNFVFYFFSGQFINGGKYKTGVCGFCKMVLMGSVVVGVCEEDKAVLVIDVLNGDIQCKALLDQQKLCQSITCISLSSPISQPPIISTLYLAQQGCHIHKLTLMPTTPNQDNLLQQIQSISLPNKNEIKLITNLIEQNKKMYCIVRKCPIIYIIGTQPNLCILQSIDYQLINPRCLVLLGGDGNQGNGGSLVVADCNKIVRCGGKAKGRVVGQLKQSKNVEYMGCRGRVVYGCTQEKQFFYLQL